jgi:hypothetical protein
MDGPRNDETGGGRTGGDSVVRTPPTERGPHFRAAFMCLMLLLPAVATSCGEEEVPRPVVVDAYRMTVNNATPYAWSNVEIWINDHYRVTRSRVEANSVFEVPLDAFVAGFGQRFDARRQPIFSVELTGRSADGAEIKHVVGQARRR